jgi:hypothetical protein
MGTKDPDLKAVSRALLQLKVRTGALLKRTSGAKELRETERAAFLLEVAVDKASSGTINLQASPTRLCARIHSGWSCKCFSQPAKQDGTSAALDAAQQLSTGVDALLSDLAMCMRNNKLGGDAHRGREVIRPLLSLLLWLLPEHIIASSASVNEASTATSQKYAQQGSNGAHAAAQGLTAAVKYIQTIAPVSVLDLTRVSN